MQSSKYHLHSLLDPHVTVYSTFFYFTFLTPLPDIIVESSLETCFWLGCGVHLRSLQCRYFYSQ